MTLSAQSHKLTLPAEINLFIIDLNSIGVAQVFYLTPMVDQNSQPIVYQGHTFMPWPLKISGIEKRGSGVSPRPQVEIANINGAITDLCQQYQDLCGVKITRWKTFANYVTANIAEYAEDFYLIEQRLSESYEAVKFELTSPAGFLNKQLPGVIAIATLCPHRYKSTANGSGCSWPGTNPLKWYGADDQAVGSAALDVCSKKISGCKLRFGQNSPLDYGGNPGLGRSSV